MSRPKPLAGGQAEWMPEAGARLGLGPDAPVCPGGRGSAGWTSFSDAVEEELIDAFLIAPDVAGAFVGWSQAQKLVRQECKSPATSFHVTVMKCSLGAGSHAFASTSSLFDSDMTKCWGRGTLTTLITLAPWVWYTSCLYWSGRRTSWQLFL